MRSSPLKYPGIYWGYKLVPLSLCRCFHKLEHTVTTSAAFIKLSIFKPNDSSHEFTTSAVHLNSVLVHIKFSIDRTFPKPTKYGLCHLFIHTSSDFFLVNNWLICADSIVKKYTKMSIDILLFFIFISRLFYFSCCFFTSIISFFLNNQISSIYY